MATVAHADSRRMYSWWWNSHISPKNSKWLQENLTDMDVKVKQMIKLIEEDADSFARRAEMYYKKRPELMKLVEEFYRAYRALAERYDHATGALRQAHRTMAEAFPNQVPLVLTDDSPIGSATDGDPRTPDMIPIRAPFDPDELQKDALGISPSHYQTVKRNGPFTEEFDSVPGRKGLKQLNALFGSGEGRARKGLNLHDVEEKEWSNHDSDTHDVKARAPTESERVSKAEMEILNLKNALAKLEAEKEAGHLQYQQSLERLSNLESEFSHAKEDSRGLNERANKAEAEVCALQEALAKLEAEKEASFLQYQQCLDKISNLENTISQAQKDAAELNERASKAEDNVQSLKQDLARIEAEKEAALVNYQNCLSKISDLENKLVHAEEEAKRFNECADKAEKEVETLKEALAKLTEEKEDASVRYLKCLETISSLERKVAIAQEEAQRLNSEIEDGVAKLKDAEERCNMLERTNQTMHSELEALSQKMVAQGEELTEKHKELGRLWTCLQEERLRFVEAETAFQTLQCLHSQSQEELRSMATELQNRAQILEDLEARKLSLQNEVEQVKVENKGLSEVNISSALTIQNLQDEIAGLSKTIEKLQAEVGLRVDERNALQQEIYCLKEELNDLNKKHQAIMGQVESVGFNSESFRSSVKDLQEENVKLKEVCERDGSEKAALLEKLEIMEKLVEKNALLENSLSDLNVELEGVRQKVKTLEESCKSLLEEKSIIVSEKAMLVSQLQVATDNFEKLTEKTNLLENSLLDANVELEGLRVKSKSLEDSCLLLKNEKSDLATMKGSLISQLDAAQKKLEDLEKNYAELEVKYFGAEKERECALHEAEKLHGHLEIEKQERASLARLSGSQLAGMASQICLLEEEGQRRKKEYEEELDKALNAQIEIFILQKCIQDLEGRNSSLLLEHHKFLEESKLSENLISKLEHQNLEHKAEVKSLYDQTKTLRAGLYQLLKILEIDTNQLCEDKSEKDQTLLNHVLIKLQATREFLFKMQDENQQLGIEKSILITLLGQLQLEVANLWVTKNALDEELKTRSEKFLVLQSEDKKLNEMNEELRLKIVEKDHKEEALMVELKNLHGQLLHLQGAYENLQVETGKVLDEKSSLMKSIADLGEWKCLLEEENSASFAETLSLNTLSQVLRDIICEKSLKIKELFENLDELNNLNNDLMGKVRIMEGKLDELSAIKDEKTELHKMMENLKYRYDEAEAVKAHQEKQIVKLSGEYVQQKMEVEFIHDAKQNLENELRNLHRELLETKSREESLKHELRKGRNEVEEWESQAAAFFGDLQISAVREGLLEGKVHEIAEACASLSDCITSLEDCTLSCAKLNEVYDKEPKDVALVVHSGSCQQTGEEQSIMASGGFLDFQELQMRIKAIEKAAMERERLLMMENLNANSKLVAAMKQIEELSSESNLHHVNPKVENEKVGVGSGNDQKLKKQTNEISEEGNEVMTKDIMLDQISECSSYGISRRETVEADDRMLEIWETTKQDGSIDLTVGKTQKGKTVPSEKKHNRENPSIESLFEKEVGIDKLEISKRLSGSSQEGNGRKILERLDSDAQKLSNLQIIVQDLKRKVEITEKSKKGQGIEYDNVKEQLEESEEAIMKLFDVNRKLMKNVEDDSLPFDDKENPILSSDETGNVWRRKISDQARRGSEKIGRLQLEVQKLQFLLLKLDDENKSRGKAKSVERKSRVLLRDYLYGGKRTTSSQKRKKGHFCACVQPPTRGD